MQFSKTISTLAGMLLAAFPALLFSQQNLIVNGNCEDYTSCPSYVSEIDRCVGWQDFSVINSCDLYNICATNTICSVPTNNVGYQFPKTGNAYIGLIALYLKKSSSGDLIFKHRPYQNADSLYENRESVLGTFTEPLESKNYVFECFVSNANLGDSEHVRLATSAFDLLLLDSVYHPLTSTSPYINTDKLINLNPIDTVVIDTLNWIRLRVCFRAEGGEKYFAVGSMRDSSKIQNFEFSGTAYPGDDYISSYYYFDSFSLIACDTCCGRKPEENVVIAGNGTSASATFQMTLQNGSEADLTLYDCLGKLILYHKFSYGDEPYVLPETLARAMYHYVVKSTAGFSQSGKVLKL